ncbi:MAG: hypothetical protein Q8O83_04970 [bacterium]|nr:hypothetical protein [bacterium]
MENLTSFESRESIIDGLVNSLAEKEGMNSEDVVLDIITFAPYEQNDASNPDYIEQVAEMIGISSEEMMAYAIKKAKAHVAEQEKK